jgi:small subunit ribosomal protein S20
MSRVDMPWTATADTGERCRRVYRIEPLLPSPGSGGLRLVRRRVSRSRKQGRNAEHQAAGKRVRSAARQRLENLRYRSTVKTLTKRLETAVAGGKADEVAAEHLALVRMIDKAASKGALHSNTAGRKKSQAARLVAGKAA